MNLFGLYDNNELLFDLDGMPAIYKEEGRAKEAAGKFISIRPEVRPVRIEHESLINVWARRMGIKIKP